jgi:hypothetical protein
MNRHGLLRVAALGVGFSFLTGISNLTAESIFTYKRDPIYSNYYLDLRCSYTVCGKKYFWVENNKHSKDFQYYQQRCSDEYVQHSRSCPVDLRGLTKTYLICRTKSCVGCPTVPPPFECALPPGANSAEGSPCSCRVPGGLGPAAFVDGTVGLKTRN